MANSKETTLVEEKVAKIENKPYKKHEEINFLRNQNA